MSDIDVYFLHVENFFKWECVNTYMNENFKFKYTIYEKCNDDIYIKQRQTDNLRSVL